MGVQNIYSVFGGRHFRYFRRGLSFLLVPTKNLQNYQFEGGSSQFLAAMSSSRSDVVTQFISPFVRWSRRSFLKLKQDVLGVLSSP